MGSDNCYLDHSWKLTLRQVGRQVRKLLMSGVLRRRRRAEYMRFQTEEEQRQLVRLMAREELDLDAKFAIAYGFIS